MLEMMTGVSMRLTDKRVDRKLKRKGYKNYEVFYSPIKCWTLIIFALSIQSIFVYGGVFYLMYVFPLYSFLYLFILYLIVARLNNSFAVEGNKLLIINRNFPFYTFKVYEFEEIEIIKIDKTIKSSWLEMILFLLGFACSTNYVEIKDSIQTKRFYCAGLEKDCYDENWTEATLDDLHFFLDKHSKVIFYLD
ncbi:MAG: hypothetical protein EAZ44_09765 [Cytophagia bacterium]|nr:MAG: hypothetical protein EAZ44_09765 [Cytophagia bacterium]TAG45120.1 MAG: hypothetical protein EAZ31_01585 [Cytophagia bacterium]TAH29635.1 MAG: hypothetical protein EAZ06_06020 [Cytophagales bacterium]